ncbi:MAG: undecaprenyl-diphosphate phosphatase [Candidatus Magasanikbacteria bacterium]|uniref:Undecaprenyl-diphosphatase n=1 Tax=Candidatus Magasanikbacteria bacterium CG10_big_fil_rev_8_21_14_0_10_38_6 TaxID=1974647 RepID=A0A2M6P045_9BACT|nr:undecaprenyl-diphosphate phosphatase [Candidatus Magasanikbacteria bacterium]NCS72106.1 undecaprenyl-diphosphate phosphatase [Candidatus Magasanikbacteria bacterium]PIR77096.1 MAG: undecaprenyl-diphosphatase [Candidatus Magasanikbacteria bacterium CG10_big_fil_rev_8_21_14_0_10_38_6]
MSILQAIILGIVQGITEFLPVSSSGHLIFIPEIFGWQDQGISFDVMVHMGTLVAVIIFFRKKIWELVTALFSKNPIKKQDRRLAWLLIASVIPAGVVGYILDSNSRSAFIVGVSLIFWGIILAVADRYSHHIAQKKELMSDLHTLSVKQIAFIACAQVLALIPGTSRSGITMTAGLFAKLNKKAAAEFSFLMGTPIIALAGGVKLLEMIQSGTGRISLTALTVGFIVSALSGVAAIAILMKIIQKWSFLPFAVYRVLIGILIILFLV